MECMYPSYFEGAAKLYKNEQMHGKDYNRSAENLEVLDKVTKDLCVSPEEDDIAEVLESGRH